jgi:hypothetical protein
MNAMFGSEAAQHFFIASKGKTSFIFIFFFNSQANQ